MDVWNAVPILEGLTGILVEGCYKQVESILEKNQSLKHWATELTLERMHIKALSDKLLMQYQVSNKHIFLLYVTGATFVYSDAKKLMR